MTAPLPREEKQGGGAEATAMKGRHAVDSNLMTTTGGIKSKLSSSGKSLMMEK